MLWRREFSFEKYIYKSFSIDLRPKVDDGRTYIAAAGRSKSTRRLTGCVAGARQHTPSSDFGNEIIPLLLIIALFFFPVSAKEELHIGAGRNMEMYSKLRSL